MNDSIRDALVDLEARGIHDQDVERDIIPSYAMHEINVVLRERYGVDLPPDFNTEWVAEDVAHKLRGKFPKRVQQFMRASEAPISSRVAENIGSIAKMSYPPTYPILVDFTRNLNWSPGDFADVGSCFWGCKSNARLMMLERQMFAVRFWIPLNRELGGFSPPKWWTEIHGASNYYLGNHATVDDKVYAGVGRAWIFPDVPKIGKCVIFNLYHADPQWRLTHAGLSVASALGMKGVKRISFTHKGETEGQLHINSGSAVLVTDTRTLKSFRTGRVNVDYSCDIYECVDCGNVYHDGDDVRVYNMENGWVCQECYDEHTTTCGLCDNVGYRLSLCSVVSYNFHGDGITATAENRVCHRCLRDKTHSCYCCNAKSFDADIDKCGEKALFINSTNDNSAYICPVCLMDKKRTLATDVCFFCGRTHSTVYVAMSGKTVFQVCRNPENYNTGHTCWVAVTVNKYCWGSTVFEIDLDKVGVIEELVSFTRGDPAWPNTGVSAPEEETGEGHCPQCGDRGFRRSNDSGIIRCESCGWLRYDRNAVQNVPNAWTTWTGLDTALEMTDGD